MTFHFAAELYTHGYSRVNKGGRQKINTIRLKEIDSSLILKGFDPCLLDREKGVVELT